MWELIIYTRCIHCRFIKFTIVIWNNRNKKCLIAIKCHLSNLPFAYLCNFGFLFFFKLRAIDSKIKLKKKYEMTPTPRFGKTPLEILSNDEELDDSLAYKYGIRFAFGLLGCGYPFFRNFGQRRPVLAGKIYTQILILYCVFLIHWPKL